MLGSWRDIERGGHDGCVFFFFEGGELNQLMQPVSWV